MMQRIYFFRRPSTGHIKIGCAGYVRGRLSSLSRLVGERLEFLAALEGNLDGEKYLHNTFSENRVRGEWFHPTDALLSVVEAARAKTAASLVSEEHLGKDLLPLGKAAEVVEVPPKALEGLFEDQALPVYHTPLGRRRFARADLDTLRERLENTSLEITFPRG